MTIDDELVPWTEFDWGVDDTCPITHQRRKFGKWRMRLSRRLTGDEMAAMRGHHRFQLGGGLTPTSFKLLLPDDVTVLRERGRLPLGKLED